MNRKINKTGLIVLLSIIISSILTFSYEVYANRYALVASQENKVIDLTKYVSYTSNLQEKDGKILVTSNSENRAIIKIEGLDDVFIGKVNITYESGVDFDLSIIAKSTNKQIKSINSRVSSKLGLISKNINHEVDSLEVQTNSDDLTISSITATNLFALNSRRMFFTFILLEVIFLIIFFRKFFVKNLQFAFILILLTLGTGIIYTQPTVSLTSLDDEVHFRIAYGLSHPGYQKVSRSVKEVSTAYPFPFSLGMIPSSIDELRAQSEYLNTNHIDGNYATLPPLSFSYSQFAYIPSAIMLKVGTTLNLPFTWLYRLGKLGTLFAYAILGFFAISHAKIGKKLLFVVALIPTNLFQAAQYSYDPIVVGSTLLFFSYLSTAWIDRNKLLCLKEYAVMLGSFLMFSLAKAVYAPFFLMLLLLPKLKFKSKRQHILFKVSVLLICLLMLSTFVLPMLVAPPDGDMRGSLLVDSPRQFAFILRAPFVYSNILISNVLNTLFDSFLHPLTLARFAYFGTSRKLFTLPLLFILIFTALTSVENGKSKLDKTYKIAIIFNVIAVMSLIWTALYIAFTPVESTIINGVQGRYYLPFFFPLLICLGSKRFSDKFNRDIFINIIMISVFVLNFILINIFLLRAVAL